MFQPVILVTGNQRKRTSVVVIAPTPPPVHGVAVMTDLLLDGLVRADRLCAHIDSRDSRQNPSMGRFAVAKATVSVRLLSRVVRELRRHQGAALYVPISQSRWALLRDGLFLYAARAMRRKRIVHLHGGHLASVLDENRLLACFLRGGAKGRTVGWVLTESLVPQLRHVTEPSCVQVLANAVRDPATATTGKPDTTDSRVNLLLISNLASGKGHEVFLSAIEKLAAYRATFRVRLAGGGPREDVAHLCERVSALQLAGWDIRYEGSVAAPERADLLNWADIFVMPTEYKYEGQPLVILEALASHCAIIATAQGGIADTIDDGVEGRLVVAEAEAVSGAIVDLAASPSVLRNAQSAARARYEKMYAPQVFFARLEAITHALDAVSS